MADTIQASATLTLLREPEPEKLPGVSSMRLCRTDDDEGISWYFKNVDRMLEELRDRLPLILAPFRLSVGAPGVELSQERARLALHRLSNAAYEIERILCCYKLPKDRTLIQELREYLAPLFIEVEDSDHPAPLIRIEGGLNDSLAWLLPFELLPVAFDVNDSGGSHETAQSYIGFRAEVERLSKHGDPLEVLDATVDFEYFRNWLVEGLGYGDGAKGGRPPFDPVAMFKALILQAQHNLSDAKMEFMIRDRLSWMRFFGFDLGGPTPDENTIRHFRNRLTETGTLRRVMKAFDWQLHKKGFIPMSGQICPSSGFLGQVAR